VDEVTVSTIQYDCRPA